MAAGRDTPNLRPVARQEIAAQPGPQHPHPAAARRLEHRTKHLHGRLKQHVGSPAVGRVAAEGLGSDVPWIWSHGDELRAESLREGARQMRLVARTPGERGVEEQGRCVR